MKDRIQQHMMMEEKEKITKKENVEKGFPGNANITSSTPLLFCSFVMVYFKLLLTKESQRS